MHKRTHRRQDKASCLHHCVNKKGVWRGRWPYLSISTHHHLFASKHDVSSPLQAEDRNTVITHRRPNIYSHCLEQSGCGCIHLAAMHVIKNKKLGLFYNSNKVQQEIISYPSKMDSLQQYRLSNFCLVTESLTFMAGTQSFPALDSWYNLHTQTHTKKYLNFTSEYNQICVLIQWLEERWQINPDRSSCCLNLWKDLFYHLDLTDVFLFAQIKLKFCHKYTVENIFTTRWWCWHTTDYVNTSSVRNKCINQHINRHIYSTWFYLPKGGMSHSSGGRSCTPHLNKYPLSLGLNHKLSPKIHWHASPRRLH